MMATRSRALPQALNATLSEDADAFERASVREAAQLIQRQEDEEARQKQWQHVQAYEAGPSSPLPPEATPRRNRPQHSAAAEPPPPPFETVSDRNNPLVQRILAMARLLGIDSTQEFYLLPLAQHALSTPEEWTRIADTDKYSRRRMDLSFYQDLVLAERLKFRHTPNANSPWVKILDTAPASTNTADAGSHATAAAASPATPAAASHTAASSADADTESPNAAAPAPFFYYNFKTFHRAETAPPPPPRDDATIAAFRMATRTAPLRPSGGALGSELSVMRFSSFFLDPSGVRRLVRIAYHLAEEEFEVALVAAQTSADQDPSTSDRTRVYRVKGLKSAHPPHAVATCWDLHVRATLDVFGRPTTLLQCDSATRAWLESNARRLLSVRAMLAEKLSKFTPKVHTRFTNATQQHALVECHLRGLMKDVAALKSELALFRPALADKFEL